MTDIILKGNIVDPVGVEIFKGQVIIYGGKIHSVIRKQVIEEQYIFPGFIDSHIHIESSMLTPSNFASIVISHGTTAVVSDPHEIANVLGIKGVKFMISDGRKAPLKFFFGAPSCVPATDFENSGAKILSDDIEKLFKKHGLKYLSEMMNFPGVIFGDPEVIKKINLAKRYNCKIDGHAPGLTGAKLDKYIDAGIDTDHECFTYEEALEKIKKGMNIQIREGSAARNFENLKGLINKYPDKIMLCSDDLHPDALVKGHLNRLIKKGLNSGLNLLDLISAVTVNPVRHYNLECGLMQVGDPADICVVDNLDEFNVIKTYINGDCVYEGDSPKDDAIESESINRFYINSVKVDDIAIRDTGKKIKVIKAIDGELVTKSFSALLKSKEDFLCSDIEKDILKIVVINRYSKENPAVGFINGFNFKRGGMVSTIAHDSHNIICVGVDDDVILELVEWAQANKGGIAVHDGESIHGLPLPVAGILSDKPAFEVAKVYLKLNNISKKMGCTLEAPFMTLSFMALLVIPELKIGNKGLFDVNTFSLTSIYI